MVRIFNKKLGHEILIDETHSKITLHPKPYEVDNPHFEIQLGGGFNFGSHIQKCSDCKAFHDAFGTLTRDWSIEYHEKTWVLDLAYFSSDYYENKSQFKSGIYFFGTILKLNLAKDTKEVVEGLKTKLKEAEELEKYEYCCVLRDAIVEIEGEV